MMSRILLLGGEGFVGRNISETLSARFDCSSVGIASSVFPRKDSFLSTDPYRETVSGEYDVVIHLIDHQIESTLFERGEEMLMRNIKWATSKHLIVFSSAVLYANPSSPYGKRKMMLEDFYEKYCRDYDIHLTVVRLFNTYGKFQFPYRQGSLVANLLFNYFRGVPSEIIDMNAMRDFMYAGDIGVFIQRIIEERVYETIDLATENMITIGELIEMIRETLHLSNMDIHCKNISENISCPAGKNILLDKTRLTPIEEGIKKTFSFYQANRGKMEVLLGT